MKLKSLFKKNNLDTKEDDIYVDTPKDSLNDDIEEIPAFYLENEVGDIKSKWKIVDFLEENNIKENKNGSIFTKKAKEVSNIIGFKELKNIIFG